MTGKAIHRTHRRTMLAGLLVAPVFGALPAIAQTPPLQTQETNAVGVIAELMECKREDGVLTVRVRFRNTGDKVVDLNLVDNRNYDAYYATANSKKYFVLRDSEKNALAPAVSNFGSLSARLNKGDVYNWWAKYPAPPADVKKISYFTPLTPPFDSVPIKD